MFEIGWSWESVNACIQHEFECTGLELEHAGLPDQVHLLLGSQGQQVALHLQVSCVACQVFLNVSSCFVSYFCPDLGVKDLCQMFCPVASIGGDGVVHGVQVDGVSEHLLRHGGCLAPDILGLSVESMIQHIINH